MTDHFIFIITVSAAVLGMILGYVLARRMLGQKRGEDLKQSSNPLMTLNLGVLKPYKFTFFRTIAFFYCGMPNPSSFSISSGLDLHHLSPSVQYPSNSSSIKIGRQNFEILAITPLCLTLRPIPITTGEVPVSTSETITAIEPLNQDGAR